MNQHVHVRSLHKSHPVVLADLAQIILPLDACKEDITRHLLGLGVSSKRGWRSEGIEVAEKELILNRAGHFDLSQDRVAAMTICPKHRRDLTVDWRGRKSSTCCYSSHKGQRKQVKDPRRANYALSQCCCPSWVQ